MKKVIVLSAFVLAALTSCNKKETTVETETETQTETVAPEQPAETVAQPEADTTKTVVTDSVATEKK